MTNRGGEDVTHRVYHVTGPLNLNGPDHLTAELDPTENSTDCEDDGLHFTKDALRSV